jgi:hypothetical protein
VLEATIHGSRKEDEKPSYLHHHVPKRAHGTKGKSGSTATRTRQSCSLRPRSKVRPAHDFPFHGGREASCAAPNENHWVLNPQHAKIWYQVVIAFLARHVLGRDVELPELLG